MVGPLLVLAPKLILPLLLVWAWVLTLSGFVGLATMVASVALPAWLAATRLPNDQPLFIYTVFMAGFIIYCHRSNIQRMRAGTEHRNTKIMAFRSRRASSDDDKT